MENSNNEASGPYDSIYISTDFEEHIYVREQETSQFGMAQCSIDSTPAKKKKPLNWLQKKIGILKRHKQDRHQSSHGAEALKHMDDVKDKSLYGQRESNEIRVVLVGRTGSGKSATGNLLLSSEHFKSHISAESVTRHCKTGTSRYKERKIVVVDTPGMFDTKVPLAQISKEIIRCIHMSLPGPHVFLLVVAAARFTNEEIETLNHLFDLFGSEMGNFAIITFTRLDELENQHTTIEAYLESSPKILKEFIKRCKNQYVAINNMANKKNRDTQIRNLLSQIDIVKTRNEGLYYTNEMYKTAEANLQQRVEEVKRKEQLKKQKEVQQIESKFVKEINTVKNTNEKLLKEVQMKEAKQVQIKKEKAQFKEDMDKMKAEMKKIDKKKDKELYEAKKREKKEKEEKMNQLKIKDNEINKLLDEHRKEQMRMNQERVELEKKKEDDICLYKAYYEKQMNQQVMQIIDQNNTTFEAMQKENQNLREELTQHNNTLANFMQKKDQESKEKDKEIASNNASYALYIEKMTDELSKMNSATDVMNEKYLTVEKELADQKQKTAKQEKQLSDIIIEKNQLKEQEKQNSDQINQLASENAKLQEDLKKKICTIS